MQNSRSSNKRTVALTMMAGGEGEEGDGNCTGNR